MSNLLNVNDFNSKIYSRFPNIYKEEDLNQKFALKRYIQALSDGGFRYIIEDINGLLDLVNPSTTDSSILEILSEYYGLSIFHGIPEQYIRQLIPHISTLLEKKGSLNVIEYLASIVSGIQVTTTIEYSASGKATFESGDPFGYAIFDNGGTGTGDITTLYVSFDMDVSLGDTVPNPTQMKRLLYQFLPFYLDLALIYTYLYHDLAILHMQELFYDYIKDHSEDNISFNTYGKPIIPLNSAIFGEGLFSLALFNKDYSYESSTEFSKDTVKTYGNDTVLQSLEEEELTLNVNLIQSEIALERVRESVKTKVVTFLPKNAFFGHAKFGDAIFDDRSQKIDIN